MLGLTPFYLEIEERRSTRRELVRQCRRRASFQQRQNASERHATLQPSIIGQKFVETELPLCRELISEPAPPKRPSNNNPSRASLPTSVSNPETKRSACSRRGNV